VNYLLRALTIPSGENTIEFKFEPQSYYLGEKMAYAGSIVFVLLIAGYAFAEFRKRKQLASK
jgi:hypothetical protein